MATPTLYWFDRWDDRIGVLPVVGGVTHEEDLDGTDKLDFVSTVVPTKGDRLVWRDGDMWREHLVACTVESDPGLCTVHALGSMHEMDNDYIQDVHLAYATGWDATEAALKVTRWDEDDRWGGTQEANMWMHHTNAWDAFWRARDIWGRDIWPEIEVRDGRVSKRTVCWDRERGKWRGARFTYGRNLVGCARTMLDAEVKTALYGYGAGLPAVDKDGNPTGGISRRATFAEKNDGRDWVGDDAALLLWGRWNKDRTERVHAFGDVTFPSVSDPSTLLYQTEQALKKACQPKVVYSLAVAMIEGGMPVEMGDTVLVVDTSRDPAWRIKARVSRRVRVLCERDRCEVTLASAGAV